MEHKDKIAVVCKLMPLYRLGVFQKLTNYVGDFKFTMFGDTKTQGGIEIINWNYSEKLDGDGIRWEKTKNYFYRPELLLWQTGIIRRILFSDFKVFIFEGAVSHLPIWLFALLCKLSNKKVLLWTHGFKGTDKGVSKIIRTIFFKFLADGLLLYGHHQRRIMIANQFDPNKLFVIYNSLRSDLQFKILEGLDQRVINKRKSEIFKNPDLSTIIFIGRLVAHKGVMEIIKACNDLKNSGLHLNCIFIGEGPEKETLFKYIQENSLNNRVHFTGSLYEENEIAKYFSMSDLMVSPGNVGLNCIHSLAYGVPVLTHDNYKFQNPEVEAIVEGDTGAFFQHGNYMDFLEKLKTWLKLNRNKDLNKRFCQEKIKKTYNPSNQAQSIVNSISGLNY